MTIIHTIVEEKRDKRIIPAHATLREIYVRYIGTADMFETELAEAVKAKIIRQRPYINGIAYELLTE